MLLFKRLSDNIKTKKQFYIWLVTYFSIIIFSLFVVLVFYYISADVLKDEVKKSNMLYLDYISTEINMNIKNIEIFSMNTMNSSNINSLMNTQSQDNQRIIELASNAIKDVRSFSNNLTFIANAHVIFPQKGISIDNSAMYSNRMIYELHYQSVFDTFEEWESFILKPHIQSYEVLTNKSGEKSVFFISAYPLLQARNQKAVIIIQLNNKEIIGYLENVKRIQSGDCFIIDGNSNAIFGTSADFPLPAEIPTDEEHFVRRQIGRINYVLSYQKSYGADWTYVIAKQDSVYLTNVKSVRNVLFACMVLLLMVGGIFAFIFTRKNYQSLEGIVNKIKTILNDSTSANSDFKYIDTAIADVFQLKSQVADHLEKQKNFNQKNAVHIILKGKVQNEDYLTRIAIEGNISLESPCFAVVIFNIMELGIVKSDSGDIDWENYKMAQFLISNVYMELLEDDAVCYFTELADMYVCLLNYKETEVILQHLVEKTQYLVDFLRRHLGLELICAVSNIEKGIANISNLYEQSLDAIEYRFIKSEQKVLVYSNILKSEKGIYVYNPETEKQLYNLIVSGDTENAVAVVDIIFDENFKQTNIGISSAKWLVWEVTSTVVKAMRDMSAMKNISLSDNYAIFETLMSLENIEDIKNELSLIINKLCGQINSTRKSKSDDRKEKIFSIIHSCYKDTSLSVGMIADMLGISDNYLSKYFKDQTGFTVADYITRYRLNAAKELLQNTDMKVSDVAQETGFYNANVFIRSFKKGEGITPGKYKEIH